MKIIKIMLISFGLSTVVISNYTYAANVRLFVRHTVSDFKVWQKGYDSFAPMQKQAGVFHKAVYQSIDNPNDVTVIHDFHSLEQAKAFISSKSLVEAMSSDGVQGKPEMWITTITEKK